MDIIAPIIQQPYNVTATTPTKAVDSPLQHNLIPKQVLQAAVLSVAADQVVLDFGEHTLTATTRQPLTAGQKLNLQVITTEPQLQFQVVDGKGDPSLLRLLHLFDHRSELGAKLSNLLSQRPASANSVPANSTAPSTSQNFTAPQPSAPSASAPQSNIPLTTQGAAGESAAALNQGLGRAPLDSVSPRSVPTPVAVPATDRVTQPQNTQTTVPNQPLSTSVVGQNNATTVPTIPLPFSSLTEGGLGPLQRQALEGALAPQQWAQLEQLSSRMMGDMSAADSKLVVNLARMLGLDFEALLAKDQLDQANAGLKGMLAALKSNGELPESVRDNASQMSQQLDILQLCRLRLAQEGILFLPLPFEFLEQGYVLFEQPEQGSDGNGDAGGHLVSLNLTLGQLGPMQVNLLFEQQALFVRIKCQDEATVSVVEGYCDELHESLQPFSIRSIQVTPGAQDPALTLLDRLQPQIGKRAPLFDARV